MPSSLFRQIVFGPIHSRRLGLSLGVNVLPAHGKWCSFDCIYCECGWNADGAGDTSLPSMQEVSMALAQKLAMVAAQGALPDAITFSGNGEPTLHPHFKEIIEDTVALRSQYAPHTKVCVLSNASQLHRPGVFEGLLLADKRIMKIDSAFPETVHKIDQPAAGYDLHHTIHELKRFDGDFSLQTLFVRGRFHGSVIDNTTPVELQAWIDLIRDLKPKEVMIYAIDRQTPAKELEKIPVTELEAIADMVKSVGLNIDINIAG